MSTSSAYVRIARRSGPFQRNVSRVVVERAGTRYEVTVFYAWRSAQVAWFVDRLTPNGPEPIEMPPREGLYIPDSFLETEGDDILIPIGMIRDRVLKAVRYDS